MSRIVCLMNVCVGLGCLAASAAGVAGADQPAESPDSRYDQVQVANHCPYYGLIESEDRDWLTLIRIQAPRGQQMHLVIQPLDKSQLTVVSRLDDAHRAALQKQIEEFRNRATIEAMRMEAVQLGTRQAEGFSYRHYGSRWFTLDSTADEQNTRRMVVRAEQIFAAYRQIVRPRIESSRPRLVLLGSMDQYQVLLARLGLKTKIENPACFLEDQNVVAIGSDLARLSAVSGQITAQNAQLRGELRDLEQPMQERLKTVSDSLRKSGLSEAEIIREVTREREKFRKQVEAKKEALRQSDQQIDRLFKRSASQTLVRLYHESFHAYLRNCVYPRQTYQVPPWLNEGLAVIFEAGQLEGNSLRVDAPNPVALKKLKADLAGPEPLGLERLLSAGEGQFLLTASTRSTAVDRYYVNAWGLAYYLTFEKRLLGSPALEVYLQAGGPRLAPVERFQQLTGMRLEQFERQWRDWIRGEEMTR